MSKEKQQLVRHMVSEAEKSLEDARSREQLRREFFESHDAEFLATVYGITSDTPIEEVDRSIRIQAEEDCAMAMADLACGDGWLF